MTIYTWNMQHFCICVWGFSFNSPLLWHMYIYIYISADSAHIWAGGIPIFALVYRTTIHYNNIAVLTCVEIVGVVWGGCCFYRARSIFHLRFAYCLLLLLNILLEWIHFEWREPICRRKRVNHPLCPRNESRVNISIMYGISFNPLFRYSLTLYTDGVTQQINIYIQVV